MHLEGSISVLCSDRWWSFPCTGTLTHNHPINGIDLAREEFWDFNCDFSCWLSGKCTRFFWLVSPPTYQDGPSLVPEQLIACWPALLCSALSLPLSGRLQWAKLASICRSGAPSAAHHQDELLSFIDCRGTMHRLSERMPSSRKRERETEWLRLARQEYSSSDIILGGSARAEAPSDYANKDKLIPILINSTQSVPIVGSDTDWHVCTAQACLHCETI